MQRYVNKSKSKSELIPTTTSLYGKQVQPEAETEYSQTFASTANKFMHDTALCKKEVSHQLWGAQGFLCLCS